MLCFEITDSRRIFTRIVYHSFSVPWHNLSSWRDGIILTPYWKKISTSRYNMINVFPGCSLFLHYLCLPGEEIQFRHSYKATMFGWPRNSGQLPAQEAPDVCWWLYLMDVVLNIWNKLLPGEDFPGFGLFAYVSIARDAARAVNINKQLHTYHIKIPQLK